MAKTINLGKVGITLGGDYDSSKNYASRTCVFYNHVSWTSKKDVPAGIAPGTNDEYWQKVSERGAQGIQGERGPQGNSAFDGTGIELVNNLTQGGEASVLSAEQGKILKTELTELESDLIKEVDVAYDEKLSNSYIKRNGEIGNYDYFYVNLYNVVEGDKFQISFPGVGATITYQYAIYSSSELNQNNAIEVGNSVQSAYSILITIPKGGVVLAVNSQIGGTYATIKKISKVFNVVDKELKELKDDVSKIEDDLNLGLSEVTSDLGEFVFDSVPEKPISTISSKMITEDGSLADYDYDRIDVYPIEEGKLYRVKGQTITGGLYAFGFYSSDTISSETLVEIGKYVSTGGVVGGFDFFTKAPLGSTHIAISRYSNSYPNYDSPLALYKGVYSGELKNDIDSLKPIKREVDNLNSAVFTKVAKPVQSEYVAGQQLIFNGNLQPSDLYGVYRVNVVPGEEYHFYRGYDIGGTGSMTYALYSSEETNSNTVVEIGPAFDDPIDLTIKIPDGVVMMLVGKVTSYDTQVSKLEPVSRFENQEASSPNFAVEVVSEEEIRVTRRYSETEDVRVVFKKCGANNLMAIYSHSFIDNTGKLPSFGSAKVIKNSGTDWIGPYIIKADNREGSYTGFTGGWHGYNGDQTGAKTADTIDIRMLVDNRAAEIGNYYCNDVKLIVTNLIQAGNTKAEDGNGINVLKEVVTYHFGGTKIYVSVVMTALEDVSFNTYYGMQVTNYGQSIRYFADNVVYKEWGDSANRTDKKNLQFFVCKGTDGRYVKAAMDIVGLGTKEYSIPSSIAFVSGGKAYYSLVSSDWNKTLTLVQGEQAYWRGYYEFIPAEFTDSCIL